MSLVPSQLNVIEVSTGVDRTINVAYKIYDDDTCVFSSLTKYKGSSINHAEAIVYEICQKNNLKIENLRFFDLQTSRTYGFSLDPNQSKYHYDEVIFVNKFAGAYAESWIPTKCPDKVLEDFGEFIS